MNDMMPPDFHGSLPIADIGSDPPIGHPQLCATRRSASEAGAHSQLPQHADRHWVAMIASIASGVGMFFGLVDTNTGIEGYVVPLLSSCALTAVLGGLWHGTIKAAAVFTKRMPISVSSLPRSPRW